MSSSNSTINSAAIKAVCLMQSDFGENFNISSLPDTVKPTWIFFAVVNGVAAPPTFVVNLLIIWTVLEKENLRSNSYNILLAVLAFTDLLVGLVVQPLCVFHMGCLSGNCQIPCLYTIIFIPITICLSMTMSTLMMAAVERYLAVEHPFFYQDKVTSKRIVIATSIIWIIIPTVLIVSRPFLEDKSDYLKKVPSLLIAIGHVIVISYCTAKVQITAHRQRKYINARVVAVQGWQEEQGQSNRIEEYKRTFTVGMLVLATFVFCCPVIITVIIETVLGKYVTDDFKYISQTIVLTFINLQSLVNPMIMSLRMSIIREGVKKKIIWCVCR